MEESESLDALSNLLNELAQKPYDISLHSKHIRQSATMGGSYVDVAQEMFISYFAAGEDIWIPLLEDKQSSEDLESSASLEGILALFERAEGDYLSIPILQKHIEFLVSRHAHFASQDTKHSEPGELFSTDWTRSAISAVVAKGIGHLTQSHLLWDAQRNWEIEMLETATNADKESLVNHIQSLHLNRLRQPHSNLDETFQSYSSFTTNYKPPQQYESLLVAASKLRSQAMKSYERREASELSLTRSEFSLDAYARYLAAERRAKYPDLFIMKTLYERAISEAAKRRFNEEAGAEEMLRLFWVGFCDTLRLHAGEQMELEIFQRGVRSVPASGELWARYLRYSERLAQSEDAPVDKENAADLFQKALSTNLIQADVEQIVPLILARAGSEKRLIESGNSDEDAFITLIAVLESGIEMVHRASLTGDPRFRLEKYLTEIYLHLADLPDSAITVWQKAAKRYKTSYLAWTSYTDLLVKQDQHDQARTVFKDLCMKNLDWPEAIWEAWISFEHLYGSVHEVDACLDKIEKAQYQVNARRAKESEKASYQAMQPAMDSQAVTASTVEVVHAKSNEPGSTRDVEPPDCTSEGGTKRKADNNLPTESHKKAKIEQKPVLLKRDRENCTVFVADLHSGVTEEDLSGLFKDCGNIREVKITQLPKAMVATVEFFDRESVPGALTKDKKRLCGNEVAVHLAWKSTLYVTNFPEKADDALIRNIFGQYGIIFDIRWPSKKFKNTRRFCYVQYTSPSSAEKALELHGRELETGHPMNVFISNPERKKERTDVDANEREVFVTGLSKFTSKADLENLFKTYGDLKEVRMAVDKDGSCKGFAFVEFDQEIDAQSALAANNYELKKRRIAVTSADSRVRARNRNTISESGFSRQAEARNKSVRVYNLPKATQEGLLQQHLEKYTLVRRVEVHSNLNEATVELKSTADAGKLLLRTEPIIFNGNTLRFTEEGQTGLRPANKSRELFVPRAAVSRPRAGLGHSRRSGALPSGKSQQVHNDPGDVSSSGKRQDDFRKMLEGQ